MAAILSSSPRLTSTTFIADLFHIIAEASSIIFYLHGQFFAIIKIFELERLWNDLYVN